MDKDVIRLGFSFLAAAVVLAMAQEWFTWALQDHKWWKIGPGMALTAFALFEAHQVWTRVEKILGL